jgi:hypothetical protein
MSDTTPSSTGPGCIGRYGENIKDSQKRRLNPLGVRLWGRTGHLVCYQNWFPIDTSDTTLGKPRNLCSDVQKSPASSSNAVRNEM